MSITLSGSPTTNINPIYNPLVYYFDSTNKHKSGFRYVVEVYKAASTTKLFEKTIIPDFDNGFATVNLNRELSDFISYDLDFDNLNGLNYRALNSYFGFDLDIGEEYVEDWEWDDYGYAGTNATINWPNYNNPQYNRPAIQPRTMLYTTDNSNQPPYQNGETIFVELNSGTQEKPSVRGVQEVLDVFNAGGVSGIYWVVVLGIPYVGDGISAGGTSKYSDFRKTRFSNLEGLNNQCAFNTVLSTRDFLSYSSDTYNMNTTAGPADRKFLTQVPSNYTVREDNTFFVQYMAFNTTSSSLPRTVKFTNNNGDESELTGLNTAPNIGVWGLDVSPTRTNWGTSVNGTLPIVKSDTKWYTYQMLDLNGNPISEVKKITIDRSCNISDSTMEMLWMDKFGSFVPYNFTARNVERQNINRSEYTKYLGGLNTNTNKFDYNLTDGGKEIYNSQYTRSFDLSTSYMNDADSVFFQNVLHSPVTYLKVDGEYTRCVINTNSITIKKDNWADRIRYDMTVELSHTENINI